MTTNGNGSIHVLGSGRPIGKGGDWLTVNQCRAMIAEETSKVHEWYMAQIPAYCAKMIQDALLDLRLVKIVEGDGGVPVIAPATDERPEYAPSPEAA